MMRIALGVEYDGAAFSGWQWQKGPRTVQECVERALSRVAAHPVTVLCAGRTDTGVHALEQVIHFNTPVERALKAWVKGSNAELDDDVRILWAREVADDFHARYSAIARFYRYVILNRQERSALHRKRATWHYHPLNVERMHEAAQTLLGEHDFSSFRAQSCQSKSPRRTLHFIHVKREGDFVTIELAANAFLHHMVRNIAAVLMDIGSGKKQPDWTLELLEAKNRKLASVTAPPDGLYLGGVLYPAKFGFETHPVFAHLPENADRYQHPVESA